MNTIYSLYLFGQKPQSYGLNHRTENNLTSLSEFNGRYTSTTLATPPQRKSAIGNDFSRFQWPTCHYRDPASIHLHLVREDPLARIVLLGGDTDETRLLLLALIRHRTRTDHIESLAGVRLVIDGHEMVAVA